jgi:hypothetical protein
MDKITLRMECPFCGAEHRLDVSEEGLYKWEAGELIQNALPELSPTEREQLISQLCPWCQKKIFGE